MELLDVRRKEIDGQLVQARVSLERLDSMRMIAEESRKLEGLEAEKKTLMDLCRKLEHFQTVVSELMNQFFEEEEPSRIRRYCHPSAEMNIRLRRRQKRQPGSNRRSASVMTDW